MVLQGSVHSECVAVVVIRMTERHVRTMPSEVSKRRSDKRRRLMNANEDARRQRNEITAMRFEDITENAMHCGLFGDIMGAMLGLVQ